MLFCDILVLGRLSPDFDLSKSRIHDFLKEIGTQWSGNEEISAGVA